ncbi:MAG: hypothetical protein ACE5EC_09945 [Phycisphaerae bacterium]
MDHREDALEILLIIRHRLLDRMASVIVEHRKTLLNGSSRTNNPLSCNADLAEISRSLGELDAAIAGLADLPGDFARHDPPDARSNASTENTAHVFDRFIQLVSASRMEEASQELSRLLRMPLDGMITATRFFFRGMKADPELPKRLNQLCSRVVGGSEAECIGALIQSFGFQAVESRHALQALRALTHGPGTVTGT